MNASDNSQPQGSDVVDPDLLDPVVVSELAATITYHRLLVFSEALRAGCHEAIVELRDAAGSTDETVAVAHRLRGMVSNLGLRKLSEIAAKLERSETWPSEARLSAVAEFEARLAPSLAAFQVGVKR